MPFLIDDVTPKDYEDIFFHRDIYIRLKLMSIDNSIPHIIFHGPTGSGKKTMINIFLKMIYGDSINSLRSTLHCISGSGNRMKKEVVRNSDHHIIINPTGTNFDRYLVHEIVKQYAGTKTIELIQDPNSKFKTIQISNLDKLSHSAQTSLRRMIEVNASTCRFIMWCDNLSNVIGPLRSRCVCIRVPKPTEGELFAYMTYLSLKMNFNPNIKYLCDIIKYSECNIKVAIWCLHLYILGYEYRTNYDDAIQHIIKMLLYCNLKKIENIRDVFFNIWITNYEGIKIIRDIIKNIATFDSISEDCKLNIIVKVSKIEYNMLRCRREIIHFDSFIVHIIKIINDHKDGN